MVIRRPQHMPHTQYRLLVSTLVLLTSLGAATTALSAEKTAKRILTPGEKSVIGATATVEEVKTDLLFKARVDTGATTSSLHIEDYVIEDEAKEMADNVGKKIRFRIKNHDGESQWLESKIADVTVVRTSGDREERYKVRLTLRLHEVKKRVLVTLNDRSHMRYPMLIGRNFLRGDFIVDVDSKKNRESSAGRPAREKPSPDKPAKSTTKKEKRDAAEQHASTE